MLKKESYISNVLLYGMYFFAAAMLSTLLSTYLMDKAFSATQVSLVVASAGLTSMLVAPLVGNLQDRMGRRNVSIIVMVLAAAGSILFMLQKSFVGLLVLYALTSALGGSVSSYIEKIATTSPRFSYRSIRIWGAIGYGVGVQVSGLVYEFISPESVYLFYTGGMMLAIFGIVLTKRPEYVGETASKRVEADRGGILRNALFWGYLLISVLFTATTGLNSTYLPKLYQEFGVSVTATTTILFIGTLMELPVIFLSPFFMNRFTGQRLLQALFMALVLQFGIYAFIPLLPMKIGATLLLKSTVTMANIMVNLKIISSIVPARYQMTAMTTAAAFKSLCSVALQVFGGRIVDMWSYIGLFRVLCIFAAIGLVLTFIIRLPAETENTAKF